MRCSFISLFVHIVPDASLVCSLGLDHLTGTAALKPYMHGYFISLKLYDAARVITNPYVYEEAREKMVKDKLDKLAEGRIRARKDQASVKVNKALAEKVARDAERARKREERKTRKKAVDFMDIDEAAEGEETAKGEAANLLTDPRFKALFEDPEFEVDTQSREFALLNPSTAAQGKGKWAEGRKEGAGRSAAKTAVEDEEEESEKHSSDDGTDSEDGSGSDDSSDAGGKYLSFKIICIRRAFNTNFVFLDLRPSHEAARKSEMASRHKAHAKVRLVPVRPNTANSNATAKSLSFGQRRSNSRTSFSTSKNRPSADEHVVRKADGTVEMSWVPSGRSSEKYAGGDGDDADGKRRRGKGKEDTRKGVERFGAGMERGGEEPYGGGKGLSEQDRSGRTERRRGVRSGSKNTFRRL